MKYELSIVIPSRNEMFISKTVEDILSHTSDKTEVIVGLDGQWAEPPIADHPRVTIVYYPESIGQRAMTNQLVKLSNAKYIMKTDAHVALDNDFDTKILSAYEKLGDMVTMVPIMRNLHAFNWVCEDGHSRYQGPSGPCKTEGCGKPTTRDVVWIAKTSPQSKSYCFDPEPHFQYFASYNKRPEGHPDKDGFTETMSLQGSCFIISRKRYWELNICDEAFGSWGSQGIEVACKSWLSGGRVVVNHNTWYAHMFRTQGGDFSFPYPQTGRAVQTAKSHARDIFFGNQWHLQVHPLSWLVERFWPIEHWKQSDLDALKEKERDFKPGMVAAPKKPEELKKGIIYYTDNRLNLKIAKAVQKHLRSIGLPIVSASLKPMSNMGKNIVVKEQPGKLAMFKQVLAALEASDADIIFFCEHDVLPHPSRFDYTPQERDVFHYNQNWWKIRTKDDRAIHYDANQLSGLVCYRDLAIEEFRERVRRVETEGWKSSMGYEPGTRGIRRGGISNRTWKSYKSELPDIDIKHEKNMTHQRWHREEFKNQKNCEGWIEGTRKDIPGWENLDLLF